LGTFIQAVIEILKQVPATVWVTLATSVLTLSGVLLSLRHDSKLQANQLAHDARERNRERQMSWRREVYLHAAESVSRLSGVVGRIADLNIPDQELSRVYQDDIAKINRIQVIANDKTVAAVNAFTSEFAAVYVRLFVDRSLLLAQKGEIESLGATLQRSTEAKERYEALLLQLNATQNPDQAIRLAAATEIEVNRRKAEYCSRRRQELMDGLPRAQQALVKACIEATYQLSPLIAPALFAARDELELPLDSASYHRRNKEIEERLKGRVDASMQRIDRIIEGDATDDTRKAEGAGA